METYLREMENLENMKNLTLEDIEEVEKKFKKANLDDNIELYLNSRIMKLKRSLNNKQKTKWDIFVDDVLNSENENMDELTSFILEIDEIKDETIDKATLDKLEKKYKSVLNILHERDFSIYFRDRYIREINKKIKVFHNRLDKIINPEFGVKIREIREEKNMSLKELENISGVTSSYIHRIERGLRKPSVEKVKKLAYGLGADYKEFLKMLNMDSVLEYKDESNKEDESYDLIEIIKNHKIILNGHEVTNEKKELLLNMIQNMSKLM